MSTNNDFPGMPDWLGGALIFCLGAFLTISVVGIVLLIAYIILDSYRWARITLCVMTALIFGTIAWAIVAQGDPSRVVIGATVGTVVFISLGALFIYTSEVLLVYNGRRRTRNRARRAEERNGLATTTTLR